MLNGKTMIIILTSGLTKKQYKYVNIFQNRNLQEEEWNLN